LRKHFHGTRTALRILVIATAAQLSALAIWQALKSPIPWWLVGRILAARPDRSWSSLDDLLVVVIVIVTALSMAWVCALRGVFYRQIERYLLGAVGAAIAAGAVCSFMLAASAPRPIWARVLVLGAMIAIQELSLRLVPRLESAD
jgi:hypothetical protein